MTLPKDRNGRLIQGAFPGGYEVLYFDKDTNVFCAPCANMKRDEMVESFINWEGHSLFCESCNIELESEYGDQGD